MATPQPAGTLGIPKDFSPFERSLVEKTEAALVDGLQLERWTRDPHRQTEEHVLDLGRPYNLVNKAFGYLSEVQISGKTLPALGARQEVEFGKIIRPNPEQVLKDFVFKHFLNMASWTYDDGAPGGFTLKRLLYCTMDGRYGRWPDDQLTSVLDWSLLGTKYRWSLFNTYLHDFVLMFAGRKITLSEAVSVVQHADFVHVVENPRPGYKLEVAIGYPFIDYAPIPNYFGFGPGKFNWAVKTYSFLLRNNNEVRCDMDFVAGARTKKVFDFGKFIPDPLYGTSDMLQMLTLGIYKTQPFHDFMDLQMSTQHCRVHQALMEGTSKIFAAWCKENPQ